MKCRMRPPAGIHLAGERGVILFDVYAVDSGQVLHGTTLGGHDGSNAGKWDMSGACLGDSHWNSDPAEPEFVRARAASQEFVNPWSVRRDEAGRAVSRIHAEL